MSGRGSCRGVSRERGGLLGGLGSGLGVSDTGQVDWFPSTSRALCFHGSGQVDRCPIGIMSGARFCVSDSGQVDQFPVRAGLGCVCRG